MLIKSTILRYSLCLILSTGRKNFSNLTREAKIDSKEALQPADSVFSKLQTICQKLFKKRKKLFIIIDDTIVKKIYSKWMQGSGLFYDTKIGRCITSFKLVAGLISDGKTSIPISASYLFAKELLETANINSYSKEDIAEALVIQAKNLFPGTELIVVADGLYSTKKFLTWCVNNGVKAEMRIRSNSSVLYNGNKISLRELVLMKGVAPKGRQIVRTISVQWQNLDLEVSIVRRIDKHGIESIVFQVATYKAIPVKHLEHYKKRWPIEMMFRTTKQHLGLQECQSLSLAIQQNHTAAVFMAYAIAQLEMKKMKLKSPEQALNRLEVKIRQSQKRTSTFLNQDYFFSMA